MTWAFSANKFQFTGMLMVIFWSCVEVGPLIHAPCWCQSFSACQEGIDPFSPCIVDAANQAAESKSSYEKVLHLCVKAWACDLQKQKLDCVNRLFCGETCD